MLKTKKVTWESSDKEIATVDSNGKVTAVSTGKVTITVTTNDRSKKASCLITVNDEDAKDLPFEVVGQTDKDYFSLGSLGTQGIWVSSYIGKFNNGLALVYVKDKNSDFKMNYSTEDMFQAEDVLQNGKNYSSDFKSGFIDSTGKEIIIPKYNWISDFSEGLAAVELNGKWGYVDKTGREVVPLKYDDVHDFLEGLAAVELNGKWGYIDKTGREVVPLRYDDVHDFSEGLAAVELNGKWGYVDKTGKEVIPLRYDWATEFSDGLVRVEFNGKYGYIDKTGKEVIPLKYDGATDFSEGLAAIKSNGKWQIIKMKK